MPDATPQHDQFMRLFIQHQPRIYACIRTLVFNRTDAEEILQETAAVLWRKFDEFTPGTRFDRWACHVAYLQVMYFRQKLRRGSLMFSTPIMDALADQTAEASESFDEVRAALESCINQLDDDDRDLLRRRYEPEATNRSVARAAGRSESAISRALHRIYRTLLTCIRRKTEAPESAGGAA